MYNKALADIALGKEKAELVLKNAIVVQVLTNELIPADVAIHHGMIVGVGNFSGVIEKDMKQQYLCPGFMDAHLHLESTLVHPEQLIHCASLYGTTTFIVDPHEAANVCGLDGIEYMLSATSRCQANVYFMMPSCVPSRDFEDNGATIDAAAMEMYTKHPRILGLGEVMDCESVLSAKEDMLRKLNLFQKKILDGHAGFLNDKELGCYALSGIHTDHECSTFESALRELRAGLYVLVREGTAAKNLEAIMKGVIKNQIPCQYLAFCTDDKHIEEIRRDGHISNNIKKAIELGLPAIEAIKMATLHTAQCYGLKNQGIIAPGYEANMVVLSNLEKVKIEEVYFHGQKIEPQVTSTHSSVPVKLLDTVHIDLKEKSEFELPLLDDKAYVIEVIPGQIVTNKCYETVPRFDGYFQPDETFQKIAVLERHHKIGKKAIGIVKGYHLLHGAIASTVGHDSHNMIVIGDNDEDMYRAALELQKVGGGYTIVKSMEEPLTLPLEVMGLMSREPWDFVEKRLNKMLAKAHEMGVPEGMDPFITLSFLSLPVLPSLRITTRGIYDVVSKKFL